VLTRSGQLAAGVEAESRVMMLVSVTLDRLQFEALWHWQCFNGSIACSNIILARSHILTQKVRGPVPELPGLSYSGASAKCLDYHPLHVQSSFPLKPLSQVIKILGHHAVNPLIAFRGASEVFPGSVCPPHSAAVP
jgi:hypothetical protein